MLRHLFYMTHGVYLKQLISVENLGFEDLRVSVRVPGRDEAVDFQAIVLMHAGGAAATT
jgi:hypothetical protein